mmetsp:Transcript_1273/g.2646  ORF Transcript_1273/g.2646 Transcript_1273/m.2646 type:complete len:107 (+) Transcript_1273:3-323(+)
MRLLASIDSMIGFHMPEVVSDEFSNTIHNYPTQKKIRSNIKHYLYSFILSKSKHIFSLSVCKHEDWNPHLHCSLLGHWSFQRRCFCRNGPDPPTDGLARPSDSQTI